jgi:chromosome segregation ATPase
MMSKIMDIERFNRQLDFIREIDKVKSIRVELGLADDVEKLTQQAKDLIPDLTKDAGFIKDRQKDVVTEEKRLTKRKSILDKADTKERELFRALDTAKDNLATAERVFKETERSIQGSKDSIIFINKRLDKTKGKASKLRSSLEKKLDTLEKAAKDLGVKIPTGDASKVLKKLISLL